MRQKVAPPGHILDASGESFTSFDGDTVSVVLIRPYVVDGAFDFTPLMNCSVDRIDLIAARSTSKTKISQHDRHAISILKRKSSCYCGTTTTTTFTPEESKSGNHVFSLFYISLIVCICQFIHCLIV